MSSLDLTKFKEEWIVYSGTGSGAYENAGNQNFLSLVRDRLDQWDFGHSTPKKALIRQVRDHVYAMGGCFVDNENRIVEKIRRCFINESVARKARMPVAKLVAKFRSAPDIRDQVPQHPAISWIPDPSAKNSQSNTTIQGVNGSRYNLHVSRTFLDEDNYLFHERVRLEGGGTDNNTTNWEASSVGSTRIPFSYWMAFLALFVLQIVIIVEDKPWKFVLVICKMFDAAPYIKTRTVQPEQKSLHVPLLRQLQELFCEIGLTVIVQIYSGTESSTEGWRANSIHADDHGDYEKLIVRVGGEFAFFAKFLGLGNANSFHSFACQGMARIIMGADQALGKDGSGILHSGIKQPGQVTLVLQLRPDGTKWPMGKKFSVEDTRDILVRLEDFVKETIDNGCLASVLGEATDKEILSAETARPVIEAFGGDDPKPEPERLQATASLLNDTLAPELFNPTVFDKLHYYSPSFWQDDFG
jgi:hypothetical protein